MKTQATKKPKRTNKKPLKLRGNIEDFFKAAMGKDITPPKKK
jgi:hypothetical protein